MGYVMAYEPGYSSQHEESVTRNRRRRTAYRLIYRETKVRSPRQAPSLELPSRGGAAAGFVGKEVKLARNIFGIEDKLKETKGKLMMRNEESQINKMKTDQKYDPEIMRKRM